MRYVCVQGLASLQNRAKIKILQKSAPGPNRSVGVRFGTKSCRGWDRWNHTAYREGAKMSNAIHRNRERKYKYPGNNCEVTAPSEAAEEGGRCLIEYRVRSWFHLFGFRRTARFVLGEVPKLPCFSAIKRRHIM